jgi:hypothetical protein
VIASIFMILFGGVMAISAITALRRPSDDTTTVGEAIVWKATGVEPLPKSRFYKVFERGFHVFLSVFGCLLLIVGIATIFTGI